MEYVLVRGEIKSGHGVASGKAKDQRYPEGTLKKQYNYFLERGLDLGNYFMGTINVDISPNAFKIKKPKHFFKNIAWSDFISPENFYFFDVALHYNNEVYQGYVYLPDPETKEEHIQMPTILELILPKITGMEYGVIVDIELQTDQLDIITSKLIEQETV